MSLTTRRVVAAILGANALLHLVEAPEYLEEAGYIGVGFILGGIALLAAAVLLWRARTPERGSVSLTTGYAVGALVSAGMLVGGVLSRTTGLPGFHESEWEASLLLSFLLEAAALVGIGWLARPATRLGTGRTYGEVTR